MRVTRFDVHFSIGVVREADAELVVDLPFELRVGAAEHLEGSFTRVGIRQPSWCRLGERGHLGVIR